MRNTRILLAVLLSVISISGLAQGTADTTRWWLPSAFGNCRYLNVMNTNWILPSDFVYELFPQGDTITDIGQYYDCDSATRIAGVAFVDFFCPYSFRIRDSYSDSVIVELRRTEDEINWGYPSNTDEIEAWLFEFYFDSVITISGNFFISAWLPPPYYRSNGNWAYPSAGYIYYDIEDTENSGQYIECNSGKAAMVRYSTGMMKPLLELMSELNYINPQVSWTQGRSLFCDIGIFPIFAEEEENNNGNGGDSDSTSALPSVEVEKYMSVFPNPASETLNVGCSYKIQSYAILNSLGQELITEKANANSLNINLSDLKSGAYYIKIRTSKGTATKPFIVN